MAARTRIEMKLVWAAAIGLVAHTAAYGCGGDSAGKSAASGGGTSTAGGDGGAPGNTANGSGGASNTSASGGTGANTGADGGDSGAAGNGGSGTGGGASHAVGGGAGFAGAPTTQGMSIAEFCDLLQERARTWLRECRSFGDSAGWWGTQRIDRFCSSGRAAVEAGRLSYHPEQAAECAALSVGGCGDIEAFVYSVDSIPQAGWRKTDACVGVVTPAVESGEPCHAHSTDYSRECREGYCSSACPGECSEFIADGQPCDALFDGCDPTASFCNVDRECQPMVPAGGSCQNGEMCAPGTVCRYDDVRDTSDCVLVIPLDGDCDASVECASGLVCHAGSCADQVPVGAVCNSDTQCPKDSYCGGAGNECLEYLEPGADCSDGATRCQAGYFCDGSSCEPLGAEDEPCPCADGLDCVDEVCTLPAALGEVCTGEGASSACEAGLWCVPSGVVDGAPDGFHCQPIDEPGDACSPRYPASCPWPLFCHPQTFTCTPRAAEGESCNLALPRDSCEAGLFCTCTSDCESAEVHEATGECTPLLEDEAPCAREIECRSQACDGTCMSSAYCY